jgi:hypothetical protein
VIGAKGPDLVSDARPFGWLPSCTRSQSATVTRSMAAHGAVLPGEEPNLMAAVRVGKSGIDR